MSAPRTRNVALFVGAAVLVMSGACGSSSPTYVSPTLVSSPANASATVTATPEQISNDDATMVYAVVDALRTKDPATIRPHIGLRKIACAANPTAGGAPKCQSAEKEGDQVEAFYFSTCEGQYLRASEIGQPLYALAHLDVSNVYQIPKKTNAAHEYSVILTDSTKERSGKAWEAIIDNGEIIGLLFSCSLTPAELVRARGYQEPVSTPAPATATPGL